MSRIRSSQGLAGVAGVARERVFDVRAVPCSRKHAEIFRRWSSLAVGEWFVLVNDHRPDPLRAQFERVAPGCFRWTDLGEAEGAASVRIERIQVDPAGFDPARVNGCGGVAAPGGPADGVLARIEIDASEDAPEVAGARVLRLAGSMPPWAELVARLSRRSPLLLRQLDLVGMSVSEETTQDGGWICRVRVAGG